MEITKNQIDQLNLEIKVKIAKKDYQGNVEQLLKNHKKKANVKGFRPGLAPMSLIKKQYQEPIRIEEINKLLSESLDKYIKTESLNILGYPIPKQKETIDWDAEELIFEYELGLSPEVRVELELVKATYYKIIASNEQLDKYIENFKLNFGEQIVLENVEEDTNLSVKIKTINNDLLDKVIYFNLKEVNKELFLGKNKNEEFTTKPSDLFTSMDSFIEITQMQKEELEGIFNNDLLCNIQDITKKIPAELGKEFYDKIYPGAGIETPEDLKNKIREEAEKSYETDIERQFFNDVVTELINKSDFSLPETFLQKLIRFSSNTPKSEEEAKAEFEESRKGLTYQLIQDQIIKDNELKITFEEVKEFGMNQLKSQMAMYAQLNFGDEELNNILIEALKNKEEYQKMADQVFMKKLINLFKSKVSLETKELSYEDFVTLATEKLKKENNEN